MDWLHRMTASFQAEVVQRANILFSRRAKPQYLNIETIGDDPGADDDESGVAVPPRNVTGVLAIIILCVCFGFLTLYEAAIHLAGDAAAVGRGDATWEDRDKARADETQKFRDCEAALSASLAIAQMRPKFDPCRPSVVKAKR